MNPHELAALRSRLRRAFPALESDVAFLENAGGSQVPAAVADRMHRYLTESYVQLGAGYPLSQQCTRLVDEAHSFVRTFVNGSAGEVILGPSTTVLLGMLAGCYAERWEPGREIVVAEIGHEANLGPWKRLQRQGAILRWWRLDPESCASSLASLAELLGERTALVAFPHVSNLLGEIMDVAAITGMAHRVGARVVVDGVAFAPHRAVDAAAWGVDWYAYSTYKVYGPHMAVLYGRRDALAELEGPNHFFVPREAWPYKFEPGGPCHEGCAGLLGLADYLKLVVDADPDVPCDRALVERAAGIWEACERPLLDQLLDWLNRRPGVRVIGPPETGPTRVGTVSFVHEMKSSREIAAAVDRSGVAIRHGHMYAYHLCEALGLDPEDGVVRASFVHYNTPEEIDRLIGVLASVI